ncbi:MAG: ABC transporter ATP-binding protein [Oscillospiraceae bacterium]
MQAVLEVDNLCKQYPTFSLQNVSFTLQKGSIMGFIGRNGAGKSTTLKSMVNMVHPTAGQVRYWGQDFTQNEFAIKQKIGFALGGANYYQNKPLQAITGVYSRFYAQWQPDIYQNLIKRFELNETKKVKELSEGMKVKYALALALSHKAEILLLDEPTSGLDPVSRDDLLELFLDIAETGTSILFSTQITTDLERCADSITYIKQGQLVTSSTMQNLLQQYTVISGEATLLPACQKAGTLTGLRQRNGQLSAMVPASAAPTLPGLQTQPASLEDIMIYTEKENSNEKPAV